MWDQDQHRYQTDWECIPKGEKGRVNVNVCLSVCVSEWVSEWVYEWVSKWVSEWECMYLELVTCSVTMWFWVKTIRALEKIITPMILVFRQLCSTLFWFLFIQSTCDMSRTEWVDTVRYGTSFCCKAVVTKVTSVLFTGTHWGGTRWEILTQLSL